MNTSNQKTAVSHSRRRGWNSFIYPILRHFRSRRGALLLKRFPELEKLNICDLGGSLHFWEESGLHPEKVKILNISLGATTESFSGEYAKWEVTLYDGKHIPAADGDYDLLICNSVIEHVTPDQRSALCAEMRRVAKAVYLQTPAFEFPLESHFLLPFLHWLPRKLARRLVRISPWYLLARPGAAAARSYFETTHLLRRSEIQGLFPGTMIEGERLGIFRKSHLVFWFADNRSKRVAIPS